MNIFDKWHLKLIARKLKESNAAPKEVSLTPLEGVYVGNIADSDYNNEIMLNSGGCGVHKSPDKALIIAFSEYVEWKVFEKYSKERNIKESTGFAAYPAIISPLFISKRMQSLIEAYERYVWSAWVDDIKIGHSLVEDMDELKSAENSILINLIKDIQPVQKMWVVKPFTSSKLKLEFFLIVFQLSNGGVICGGAAGKLENTEHILFKALSEAFRHAMAAKRVNQEEINSSTNYLKKIKFFSSRAGEEIALSRLGFKGNHSIQVPPLEIDEVLTHKFEKYYPAHLCRFKGQPDFVVGDIKRFCL